MPFYHLIGFRLKDCRNDARLYCAKVSAYAPSSGHLQNNLNPIYPFFQPLKISLDFHHLPLVKVA
jgi:hypothetical protein